MSEERRRVQAEFDAGFEGARDEQAFCALERGDAGRTTLNSYWFQGLCPRCGHSFRLGDRVKHVAGVGVVHATPHLDCAGEHVTASENGSLEVRAFFDGIHDAWPPPEDVRVTRLEPDHPLLDPPRAGFKRHTCFVCAHTLRPFDSIVICPCDPFAPVCQATVHRDPVNGLSCLESWNPAGARSHCPVTLRKLDDQA